MLIAILQFELLIHEAESLKDKRRVVASLKERIHRHHQASVAEVGLLDRMDAARIGVAVVGSDAKYLSTVLDRITERVRTYSHEAELGETVRQIISNGAESIEDEPEADGTDAAADERIAAEMYARAESLESDGVDGGPRKDLLKRAPESNT
jgi:uncharacterized protein YlxP (DUF503 family)